MYKVTILDGSEIFLDVIKGLMDEMIYEINHILNYRYGIKWSYDPHSHNFSNCIEKPEKCRTSIWHIGRACRPTLDWCVGRYVWSIYRSRGAQNTHDPASLCNCVHNCEDHSFTWKSFLPNGMWHPIDFIAQRLITTFSFICQCSFSKVRWWVFFCTNNADW